MEGKREKEWEREKGRERKERDRLCVGERLFEHRLERVREREREREGKVEREGGRRGGKEGRVRGTTVRMVECWASAVLCRLCPW